MPRRRNRRSKRRSNTALAFRRAPLPTKFTTKLKYVEEISLNPPAGGVMLAHYFSANGLFDPNVTGTGHQPMGFDQLMLFYDHYTVIGAKINVRAKNDDPSINCVFGVDITDTNTSLSTFNISRYLENGRKNWRYLGYDTTSANSGNITYKVNPAKYLGRSNPLSEPQLKGSATTNPAEEAFFQIAVGSPQSRDGTFVDMVVSIEYLVVFTEPKSNLAQS